MGQSVTVDQRAISKGFENVYADGKGYRDDTRNEKEGIGTQLTLKRIEPQDLT